MQAETFTQLLQFTDGVYKTIGANSPDVLWASPLVGNCLIFETLGPSHGRLGGPARRAPTQRQRAGVLWGLL